MVTCVHCGQQHPDSAKFCEATGKPLPPMVMTKEWVPPQPGSAEKGVFDLLREAVDLYKANGRTFLITSALVFIPGSFVTSSSATLGYSNLLSVGRAITALILYGIALPLTQGALTIATADAMLDGRGSWRDHWAAVLRRLPLLVSAIVPAALLLGVGFLLAIIPGLVLAFFFVFVTPVVLLEGVGGTAALRRSYELVRSDWLRTALTLVTFGFANGLAHWLSVLLVSRDAPFVANFMGDLLLVFVMPVPIIASVLLYLDLRRKVDGVSEEEVRERLEKLRAGS